MKKINQAKIEKFLSICMLGMIGLYVIGIILVNFGGRQYYNFDMYSDILVAKLMWEEKTLFPENWYFGNQFYVAATPVLAALVYGIIGNSFYAMAVASCLMTLFVVFSFIFCFKSECSSIGLVSGLLCIIGGAIISTNAATDWLGLQIFYTMASYYAIYLICILLSIGTYLRLFSSKKASPFLITFILLLNFSLGMNSLRQTLVFCIPMFCTEVLFLFTDILKNRSSVLTIKSNIKRTVYALSVLFANIVGVIFIRLLNPNSNPMSEIEPKLTLNIKEIVGNFVMSFNAALDVVGLSHFGKSQFGLGLLSLFFILVVVSALVIMIKKHINNHLTVIVCFCLISLFFVFCAGVFLIYIRDIYFFVWFVLVSVCVIFLADFLKGKIRLLFFSLLILISMVNFYSSFETDINKYLSIEKSYQNLAAKIKESGIKYIFSAQGTSRTIGIYSDDEFTLSILFFDETQKTGYPYKPISYIQSKENFDHISDESAAFIIQSDRWEVLTKNYSKEYVDNIKSKLDLIFSYEIDGNTFMLYRMKERIIADFGT